jgi:hypothetical protein
MRVILFRVETLKSSQVPTYRIPIQYNAREQKRAHLNLCILAAINDVFLPSKIAHKKQNIVTG